MTLLTAFPAESVRAPERRVTVGIAFIGFFTINFGFARISTSLGCRSAAAIYHVEAVVPILIVCTADTL